MTRRKVSTNNSKVLVFDVREAIKQINFEKFMKLRSGSRNPNSYQHTSIDNIRF